MLQLITFMLASAIVGMAATTPPAQQPIPAQFKIRSDLKSQVNNVSTFKDLYMSVDTTSPQARVTFVKNKTDATNVQWGANDTQLFVQVNNAWMYLNLLDVFHRPFGAPQDPTNNPYISDVELSFGTCNEYAISISQAPSMEITSNKTRWDSWQICNGPSASDPVLFWDAVDPSNTVYASVPTACSIVRLFAEA